MGFKGELQHLSYFLVQRQYIEKHTVIEPASLPAHWMISCGTSNLVALEHVTRMPFEMDVVSQAILLNLILLVCLECALPRGANGLPEAARIAIVIFFEGAYY